MTCFRQYISLDYHLWCRYKWQFRDSFAGNQPSNFRDVWCLFHSIWCMFWVSDFSLIWIYLKKHDNEMCDIPIILSFMIYGTHVERSAI